VVLCVCLVYCAVSVWWRVCVGIQCGVRACLQDVLPTKGAFK